MEAFRIAREAFSKSLQPSAIAGRWSIDGQRVIYAGASRSLSTLEFIVSKRNIKPSYPCKVMIISIVDDDHLIQQLKIKDLPENWRSVEAYRELQKIGSKW